MGNIIAIWLSGNRGDTSAFQGASNMIFNNTEIYVAGSTITQAKHGKTLTCQELLDFIPTNQFRAFQMDNLAKRAQGTGAWFLKRKDYQDWKESDGGIFWGTGIPGAGKTVLASIVIDDLQTLADDSPDTSIAFGYCRYTEKMSVKDILFAMIRQQLERKPQLADIIGPMLARNKLEKTEPSQEDLVEILKCIAKQFKRKFYNIDGLDESKDDVKFDLITTLASVKANFFITSRPLENLQSALPNAKLFTIKADDADVEQFVAQQIERTPILRNILRDDTPRMDVIRKVRENARGMFLHAVLQVETLKPCLNISQLEGELDKVPLEIGELYSTSLRRIGNQYPEHAAQAKDLLVWVLYAERPLTIQELQYALAFCPGPEPFDKGRIIPEDVLVSLCCGLVTVDSESKQIRLVHYTAKEVLQRLLKPDFPHPHELLARTCIARLKSCHFQNTTLDNPSDFDRVLEEKALLSYSYDSWVPHLRKCNGESTMWDLASQFIWGCSAFPTRWDWDYGSVIDRVKGIHLIAQYGLHEILDRIPGESEDSIGHRLETCVNASSRLGHPALVIASRLGRGFLVGCMLEVPGIDVNVADGEGKTALIWAVHLQNQDMVRRLLDTPGIDVNVADEGESTALIWAAYHQNQDMVRQLLDAPGIDVNVADEEGMTALIWAAKYENQDLARQLLDAPGIDVNVADEEGTTALIWAGNHQNQDLVRQLLEAPGIDVNVADGEGKTALIWAVHSQNQDMVRQLLNAPGIDVNVADERGNTALIWAAYDECEDIVQALLHTPGIKANLVGKDGRTTLMEASRLGQEDIVQLLLTVPSIQLNIADKNGKTALMLASDAGHEGVVQLLSDARVSTEDP